jgi:hypothetical protein
MPTEPDLSRLYDALGTETQYAPLPAPEALRRRGDRRTRSRAVLAVTAVAVLVAGVAVGGNELLGRDGSRVVPAPQPTPSVSPSFSPSVSPSPSPSVSPSASPSAPRRVTENPPATVPVSAFVQEVSGGGTEPNTADRYLPSLCGKSVPDGSLSRRSLAGFLFPLDADPADNPVPDANLTESIAVYGTPGQARGFVQSLAALTASCPTEAIESGTIRYRRWPDAPAVGHESYVVEQRIPATELASGKPTGGHWTFYTAVVRHGDAVAVLYTRPYEDWGMEDPRLIVDVMRRAYDRLAAWRGPMSTG